MTEREIRALRDKVGARIKGEKKRCMKSMNYQN